MAIRNPEKMIAAELFVCLAATTVAEVKSGKGFPRPRPLAAFFVMFSALGLVTAFSPGAGRVAAAVGGVITLGAVISGAVGKTILDLLNSASGWIGGGASSIGSAASGAESSAAEAAAAAAAKVAAGFSFAPANTGGLRPARP